MRRLARSLRALRLLPVLLCATLPAALSTAAEEAPTAAAPAAVVVFSSGAQAPWQAFAGDEENWAMPVAGDLATLDEVVRVQVEEDGSHRVSWRGRAEGQYFLAGEPADLTGLVEAAAGLVVVLQIHDAPSRDVTLRMGCGYPCMANANITRLLRALPEGEWVRFSVDAQCFADNGLWAGHVDMPFMLNTSGRLDVSIGEVRLIPGAGENATIRC